MNGTTYTWGTPVVSIAGAIAGATAESTPQSLISQTLVNLTNQLVTVTYTVTARSSSPGSCDGDPFQVVVTAVSYTHLDVYKRQANYSKRETRYFD